MQRRRANGRDGHYRLFIYGLGHFRLRGGGVASPRWAWLAGSLGVHGATLFRLCLDPGASLARPAPLQPRFEMCCDLRLGAIHDSVCVCYFKRKIAATLLRHPTVVPTVQSPPPRPPNRDARGATSECEGRRRERREQRRVTHGCPAQGISRWVARWDIAVGDYSHAGHTGAVRAECLPNASHASTPHRAKR